jgi:hypothetical protein
MLDDALAFRDSRLRRVSSGNVKVRYVDLDRVSGCYVAYGNEFSTSGTKRDEDEIAYSGSGYGNRSTGSCASSNRIFFKIERKRDDVEQALKLPRASGADIGNRQGGWGFYCHDDFIL